MRIVAGQWRGRPIDAPEGRDTRPTTDRMRESIASMILSAEALDLSGLSVLDAFAGSGAMGLELLSRGAGNCTFVERDRQALARVKRNAASLGASRASCAVVGGDDFKLAASASLPGAPFDIVFLDPPYAYEASRVTGLVEALAEQGMLAKDAIVVYERASSAPGLALAGAELSKSKKHGTTCVDLWTYGGIS